MLAWTASWTSTPFSMMEIAYLTCRESGCVGKDQVDE
jgi:hypothetical protein